MLVVDFLKLGEGVRWGVLGVGFRRCVIVVDLGDLQ